LVTLTISIDNVLVLGIAFIVRHIIAQLNYYLLEEAIENTQKVNIIKAPKTNFSYLDDRTNEKLCLFLRIKLRFLGLFWLLKI